MSGRRRWQMGRMKYAEIVNEYDASATARHCAVEYSELLLARSANCIKPGEMRQFIKQAYRAAASPSPALTAWRREYFDDPIKVQRGKNVPGMASRPSASIMYVVGDQSWAIWCWLRLEWHSAYLRECKRLFGFAMRVRRVGMGVTCSKNACVTTFIEEMSAFDHIWYSDGDDHRRRSAKWRDGGDCISTTALQPCI